MVVSSSFVEGTHSLLALVEWVSGVGRSQGFGGVSKRGKGRVVRQNRKCGMGRMAVEGGSKFETVVSMLILMLYYLYLNLEKKCISRLLKKMQQECGRS